MKVITRQSLADAAPEAWKRQYPTGPNSMVVFPPPGQRTPEAINRIISDICGRENHSWTAPPSCGECGNVTDPTFEVGEELEYDRSNTAYLCVDCVRKLAALLDPATSAVVEGK